MATGKTHARFWRLIADGVDLSGDTRAIGSFGKTYEVHPVEGWSSGVKHFQLGRPEHFLNGYQAVFNNTAATGSYTELSAQEEYIISLIMGIRAAPIVGDPCFISTMEQTQFKIDGTDAVLINAEFVKSITDSDHEDCWGVCLAPGTSLSSTTNGTSVNNGASSSNGALAHLHVTATSSGSWTLKIQDSANDADWADLITFASDGSTVTAEAKDVTGTVDQYVRFQATRSAGTTSFWVTFSRQ